LSWNPALIVLVEVVIACCRGVTRFPSCARCVHAAVPRAHRCALSSPFPASVLVTLEPRLPSLAYLDPLRVRQVLTNALSNAAKHSGGGGGGPAGTVNLNARVGAGGALEIDVLDRGRGLRGRTLAELGTEFAELPTGEGPAAAPRGVGPGVSAFNRVRSTGMGLPICVQLARLMHGSIALADRADGPGARVVRGCWCGVVL
jgi:signal transduction histidine kinase